MDEIRLLRPETMYHSPAFSQVAVVPPGATTILVGGQDGVDETGRLVGDDIAAQTRQAMANVVRALDAAGAGPADLVALSLLLVEGVDLRAGYAASADVLGPLDPPPLVTAAVVRSLAVPGALVEVSATAAVLR